MNYTKKKILYVITKSNFGGAQRYVYDLATGLPKEEFSAEGGPALGWDVAVVLGGAGLLLEKLHASGVRAIALPQMQRDIHILNDIKTFFTLIHIFRKERPDIIHLNSSKAGILGSIAGRIARVPKIIFTAHGWVFNEERPWWQKFFFCVIYFKIILFSHITIAVSRKTKEQVAWMPFIQKKILVIYNGIKKPEFKTKTEARAFLSLLNPVLRGKENALWLGTLAELHPTKGLRHAIKAMQGLVASFPHLIYIVMGGGEERKILESTIEKFGLRNNVFFVGFTPNASLYLAALDIALVPSLSEALPYVPLEAGSAKIPTVATEVGGIPEIIEHNKTGLLVPPKNSEAIAREVATLVKNKALREKLGEALFQKVSGQFGFERMIQKTIRAYT